MSEVSWRRELVLPAPAPAATTCATPAAWRTYPAIPFAGGWLAAIARGKGLSVGQRQGHRIGNLLAHLLGTIGANNQLEKHATLQLLDGVDHLAAGARGRSPFSMDSPGWWDLYLEVGVTDFALPGYGGG